jgi:serine/threonine-protein kinase
MAPAPRIGTEFAGYRIEGLLGRGGMGVVYRAEHPRSGAGIALKVMAPELATDEAFRERFVRETRLAARIRHPSIIPIYDAGEWEGDLYIAMRYIEGEDLRSLLRLKGVLSFEETHAIAVQIASALDTAHRNGLVHRDVKPANILVEPGPDPDSPPIAYLADLGLTKYVESHSPATGSGDLIGTIDYMSPEQISDSPVDGRTDVYSLACVIFECLTGSPPYVRENKAAVLWAHLQDEIPRATSVNASLPATVDDVLARGLAKRTEDRFNTGRELMAALRGALEAATASNGDRTTHPLETPRPLRAATHVARSRRRGAGPVLALAAAVGAVLGAGVAAAGRESENAPTTSATPPASPQPQQSAAAALTPFDRALLPNVPDRMRPDCRHARPLAEEFDATLKCDVGGIVDSVTFSHARSGRYMHDFLGERVRAEVPATLNPRQTGFCGTGDIPSINPTVADGLSKRAESSEPVAQEERLGFILCYKAGGRAYIEWITGEVAIYAIAKGNNLAALYDWWRKDAGPEA